MTSFKILKLLLFMMALFDANKSVYSSAITKTARKISNVRFGTIWNRIGKRHNENKDLKDKMFNLEALKKYMDSRYDNDEKKFYF